MSRMLLHVLCLTGLVIVLGPQAVQAQSVPAKNSRADGEALAKRLDKIIYKRLELEKIKPAPKADHAQLARRLHVDLMGRIPTLLQIRDFLENDSPDKFQDRVDELLAGPDFPRNFTHYFRSIMLTGTNNIQALQLQSQFENWLHGRLASNTSFDKIAQEVIASQANPGAVSPAAFNFVNENKAENLAGATARVFLGVKIECAQCHKHPFAKWTRQQFWEFAAFFSALAPWPKGQAVNAFSREIKIPDTEKIAKARFLTGEEPEWKDNVPTRNVLAEWATSPMNPYFAKAAADHVWQYFFGVSLTEPIFEPSDDITPAHPELLDELGKSFIASGFDLKFLIRAVVLTDAYQRTSVALNPDTRDTINFFAAMPIRGMLPEQLYDSFAEAADFRQEINYSAPNAGFVGLQNTPRQEFLNKFTSQDRRIELQTSILQALYLMNGKLLSERVKLDNNEALKTIATAPTTNARRVETLYLMVLSRLPRPEESARMVNYIEAGGGTNDPAQAVADIFWALLNTSEFMLNH